MTHVGRSSDTPSWSDSSVLPQEDEWGSLPGQSSMLSPLMSRIQAASIVICNCNQQCSAVFDSTILAMFWQTHKFDRTLGKLGLLPIYQNQVSNLAIYPISIDKNGHFGHSGQSDVSQNGLK